MNKFFSVVFVYFCTAFLAISQSDQPQWLRYPAVSPDGKTIAFSYHGDIYTVSSLGGQAKQLTSNLAYDFRPVWSPDSKQIAFASNRYGNFDVFLISAEGGEPNRLTFHSSGDIPYCFSVDGRFIYFSSARLGNPSSILFPNAVMHQVYTVNVDGGREYMYKSWPAQEISFSKDGKFFLFQDIKGYENDWRKHQLSSIARDIFLFNVKSNSIRKITDFIGEDRKPVWGENGNFFYLSEKSGSFNIWKSDTTSKTVTTQLTTFSKFPVRFLSRSNDGLLCFGYDGFIYTMKESEKPKKLEIIIKTEAKQNNTKTLSIQGGITEFSLSPNGKEIAFISRGEVFVTAVDYSTTKRITNTPEMERSVSFSPDGKKLIYASERNNSWNIYESSLKRPEEKYFFASTVITEAPLIETNNETFQPEYSPDGKEIAFLSDRTTVNVFNIESKKIRTVMTGDLSYSYSDGDQYFTWSPDSKWLLIEYYPNNRWVKEIGLFDVSMENKHSNLTLSGYSETRPKWSMDGNALLFFSDRYGYRSHGSWGAEGDVLAMFLNRKCWEKFKMSEEEAALDKEIQDAKDEKTDSLQQKDKDKKSEKSKDNEKKEIKPLVFELDNLTDRTARLTIHSSFLSDAYLTGDGRKLYYLTTVEKGYDLWLQDFKKKETKLICKIGSSPSRIIPDKKEENLFLLNNGNIVKINLANNEQKAVNVEGEMLLDFASEKQYMYTHVWRQMYEKFYLKDMHGVDWNYYGKEYRKYLPWITENYDFAEMLSELLGEVNASHTGSGYRNRMDNADQTAFLGFYPDETFTGDGIKIAELMPAADIFQSDSKVEKGVILEKIDGVQILQQDNYFPLLNRKAGKRTLLSFYNPVSNERWEEVVKPVSMGEAFNLAYSRWCKKQEEMVSKLSGGKIGYVHVAGMNSESFRQTYADILGKYNTCEAVIIDTRFNGGGWLHDDLATLLSGKKYLTFSPRGQENIGSEPMFKWCKPSAVIMNEGNYSDAHMFPFVYKELGIGKLIGMPVPGTGTAVWWETLIDPSLYFGIPQVGMKDSTGKLLENSQLEPDILVLLPLIDGSNGIDAQTEAAVRHLMKEINK